MRLPVRSFSRPSPRTKSKGSAPVETARVVFAALVASCLAALPVPAQAGGVAYSLAQVGGKMSVSNPSSSSWPFGTSTASDAVGLQVGGTPGGVFTGASGPPATPAWSGTLGADGKTLTPSPANTPGAPAPTVASFPYYPLGFWKADQPGGAVIPIPSAGYPSVAKNTGVGSAGLTNTVGNSTAFTQSGGMDVTGPIDTALDPVVVNYDNGSLSPGIYWMTAELTEGVEVVSAPEPATWVMAIILVGFGGLALRPGPARRRPGSASL